MISGGIVHRFHLLSVVEDESIEIFISEEMLRLPLLAIDVCFSFTFLYRKWEFDSFRLKFSIWCEVENEILEKKVEIEEHPKTFEDLFKAE